MADIETDARDKKVDSTDYKIIRILQEDSRRSFSKIADNLGIAVGTAYNRVKSLEDKGILKGYTIIADPIKLGYGLTALNNIFSIMNKTCNFPLVSTQLSLSS